MSSFEYVGRTNLLDVLFLRHKDEFSHSRRLTLPIRRFREAALCDALELAITTFSCIFCRFSKLQTDVNASQIWKSMRREVRRLQIFMTCMNKSCLCFYSEAMMICSENID